MILKNYIRSIILPIAMLLAVLLHKYCSMLYFLAPYLVFTMLFMAYTAIDVKKMRVTRLEVMLLAAQAVLVVGCYEIMKWCGLSQVLCDSVLVCILTPVAASVVVVSCALGADRETVTTFTIIDNLFIALLAPMLFTLMGRGGDLSYWESFWKILSRIAPQIVFPFFAAILTQLCMKRFNAFVVRHKRKSLYVWAFTLTIILGKTWHDVITAPEPQWRLVGIQTLVSAALCALLFAVGKWLGSIRNEKVAGGQLLGQKNTSFGIWMAIEYLTPMATVAPAVYSMWQNFFNSWQMFQHDRKMRSSKQTL